jgi:hypothetical protein
MKRAVELDNRLHPSHEVGESVDERRVLMEQLTKARHVVRIPRGLERRGQCRGRSQSGHCRFPDGVSGGALRTHGQRWTWW